MTHDNPFRRALDGWTANQWIKNFWHHPDYPDVECVMHRVDSHRSIQMIGNVDQTGRAHDILSRTAKDMFPDRADENCGGGAARVAATANDHPDTTFDDIVALLEKCAIRWDEQT